MIYLTPGVTSSIWLSLRESEPVGNTASYKFTFTNDISGETKVFYPVDLQPDNKWSRFSIAVGTPESLPNRVNMRPGMWAFQVEVGSTVLETGKILVEDVKSWTALDRPAKTAKVLKR